MIRNETCYTNLINVNLQWKLSVCIITKVTIKLVNMKHSRYLFCKQYIHGKSLLPLTVVNDCTSLKFIG